MSLEPTFLDHKLHQYFLSISLHEPKCCKELRLEQAEHKHHAMQISPEQGQFLAFLVSLIGAKRCLEIGAFMGYSALYMSLSLPQDGLMVTCDINEEWLRIAQSYWDRAGVSHKIAFRLGPALQSLEELLQESKLKKDTPPFDFVFIDADKENYQNYYEMALQLIRPGGLIAIDNTFWGGAVIDEQNQSPSAQAIRAFNQALYHDKRVKLSMLPLGDGLSLALKL